MIDETLLDTMEKMEKAVEHARAHFGTVRTGRASPALVEKLMVSYYGSDVPLQQIAGFSVPEARLLVVQPYDKGKDVMAAIEKAIRNSDLGINPSTDGVVIRLAFPPLTEERRKEFVKVVKHMAEEGRVAVRNIRRDAAQAPRVGGEGGRHLARRARPRGEGARQAHTRARRGDRQGAPAQRARIARGVSALSRSQEAFHG